MGSPAHISTSSLDIPCWVLGVQSQNHSCLVTTVPTRYSGPGADGGSIVALTFDTRHVYPFYNWMGVHKAALEALVRSLARRHGRDRVRVNAVSAGPLLTKASGRIPGFGSLTEAWNQTSPIPWDAERDRDCVADAVLFLLGPHARKITGQILTVDGGASIMGGQLMPFERPPEHPS